MFETEALTVLGLGPGSAWEDIQDRFRTLAKQLHPDVTGDPESAVRFAAVREAFVSLRQRRGRARIFEKPVAPRHPAPEPGQEVYFWGKLLVEGLSESIRKLAAGRLGDLGRKTAWSYLKTALDDASPVVRLAAVQALAKLRLAQAAGPLSVLFAREKAEIKLAILEVAAQAGFEAGYGNLLQAAQADLNLVVRQRAREHLQASSAKRHQAG